MTTDTITPPTFTFADGYTYDPDQDETRLAPQLAATFNAMASRKTSDGHAGGWCTDEQLATAISYTLDRTVTSESAGARRRDLRKPRCGGHIIESERTDTSAGVWRHRLIPAGSPRWEALKEAERLHQQTLEQDAPPPPPTHAEVAELRRLLADHEAVLQHAGLAYLGQAYANALETATGRIPGQQALL